jgi:Uma2 family endonuclease
MRTSPTPEALVTLADMLKQLGDISPSRIRFRPPPGTATEEDVIDIDRREGRLYELVDGVLVEKVMGYPESSLACDLIRWLGIFLEQHDLGVLAGEGGTMRLMRGLVRIPDISFVAWERLPNRQLPDKPIPDLAPDLAVEVLSRGNTKAEMARKIREYFLSGTRLVWLVDPRKRTVRVYSSPERATVLKEGDVLDGGDVLSGLKLPLRRVFARVPRTPGRRPTNGKRKPKA